MLFVDDRFRIEEGHHGLVKPDGWSMPPEAEKINGLSNERLEAFGQHIRLPLHFIADAINQGRTLVAHNLLFDAKIMRGEMRRLGWPEAEQCRNGLCTMRALTPVCALSDPKRSGFKFPRLAEAYQMLLGKELVGAHDALTDALACFELLRWMKTRDMPVAIEAA